MEWILVLICGGVIALVVRGLVHALRQWRFQQRLNGIDWDAWPPGHSSERVVFNTDEPSRIKRCWNWILTYFL